MERKSHLQYITKPLKAQEKEDPVNRFFKDTSYALATIEYVAAVTLKLSSKDGGSSSRST